MRSGLLRERVTINTITETNTSGSLAQSSVALGTFWARVEPIGGEERFLDAAAQRVDRQPYRLTLRYLSTVTPQDEVVWGSRTLEIAAVRHHEKQRETILECFERPA